MLRPGPGLYNQQLEFWKRMAKHLDLEEQEQLDQLKHFWKQYGDLITWALIAIFGTFAAWNGYQYWQRSQAEKAAVMFDLVERAVVEKDNEKLSRALADMQKSYARSTYTQQAGLIAAKAFQEGGKADASTAALTWVADNASDAGYKAVARLRLVGSHVEAKAYDEALKQLDSSFPKEFAALAADRKGDVLLLQGKRDEARASFTTAFTALDESSEYRRLIEVKLNALGVDPRATKAEQGTGGKS